MARRDNGTHTPPHVLVLDDDDAVRGLLCSVLEDEGYLVTERAAPPPLAEVRALAPDLVLLDLRFRCGGDGLAFVAALRGDAGLARLPVVVCSAAADRLRDEAATVAALGAAVVPKPFDLDDLARAVEEGLTAGPRGASGLRVESSPAATPSPGMDHRAETTRPAQPG